MSTTYANSLRRRYRPVMNRLNVTWWPFLALAPALMAALLGIPYLDVPLDVDAGGYALAAYWWARGDTLYQHFTITRPQGIFVLFRFIEALGLGSVRGIHLFAALYTATCILALVGVVARVWDRATAVLAGTVFAVVFATPYFAGFTANAELFMLLPLLGSLGLLLLAGDTPAGSRLNLALLAGSGFLAAIALLIKPSGVVALPLAACWLARRWWRERHARGALVVALGALAGGFTLGLAPALAHGLLTAPTIYLDAVVFNRLGQDSILAASPRYQVSRFIHQSAAIAVRLPVLLLAAPGVRAAWRGPSRARDLLVSWLGTSLLGAALGGNWYLHYYQQVLPPLAVAVALGLRALVRRPARTLDAVSLGVALGGVLGLALALAPVMRGRVDLTTVTENAPVASAAAQIASYLKSRTTADETIYVAYDRADIYYLAQRYPAARWLYFRELGWTPGAFADQVARLADAATAPIYIVGAQPFDDYGFDGDGQLRAVVARDYVLETTIEGIPLYRRAAPPEKAVPSRVETNPYATARER